MKIAPRLLALLLVLATPASAAWHSVLQVVVGTPSHTIAFTTLANMTQGGSAGAGSGTYTGAAQSSYTGAWNAPCSGSSTITPVTATGGAFSITATPPASTSGTCTLTITDNLGGTATSPGVTISGGSYVGPGDIKTYSEWWGLRAYSAAEAAAATAKIVNVSRVTDSHTCDFIVATNGGFGVTANCSTGGDNGQSLATFAGTDVTGTGGITGSTLTLPGAHIGDVISGSGVLIATYITSGSSPTWQVSITHTVASTTLTATRGLAIVKLYTRTGTGHDQLQNGALNPVYLLPNGSPTGLLPAVGASYTPSPGSGMVVTITAISQPFSLSAVAIAYAGLGAEQYVISGYNGTGAGLISFDEGGTANNTRLYCGSDLNVTSTDGNWHAMQGVCNGTSSRFSIDSITPTTGNAGTTSTSTQILLAAEGANTQPLNGLFEEAGVVASATSTGDDTSLIANERAYWGF
jgi:hypothetical protein